MKGVASLFSPLGSQYCFYFYYLSIFSLVLLVLYAVPAVYTGITKRKNFGYYLMVAAVSLHLFITYFVYRLLYSMCIGSLK